jgi:hypothetical protein
VDFLLGFELKGGVAIEPSVQWAGSVGAAESVSSIVGAWPVDLGRREQQIAHADWIVGRQSKAEQPTDPSYSPMPRFADSRGRLEPAEDLLDAFPRFWTRSPRWPPTPRANCYAPSRSARCGRWAARAKSQSTCARWPPPIAILTRRWPMAGCARTCTIACNRAGDSDPARTTRGPASPGHPFSGLVQPAPGSQTGHHRDCGRSPGPSAKSSLAGQRARAGQCDRSSGDLCPRTTNRCR